MVCVPRTCSSENKKRPNEDGEMLDRIFGPFPMACYSVTALGLTAPRRFESASVSNNATLMVTEQLILRSMGIRVNA